MSEEETIALKDKLDKVETSCHEKLTSISALAHNASQKEAEINSLEFISNNFIM
jgi:hypothetical protein